MSYKVTGRIREAESGLGVPNLIVKVLDKDWRLDDELGGARTDAAGKFAVAYEEEDFRDLRLEREPDLYLVVRTPDNARVLYSSADQVRQEAGKAEHYEIEIDKETLGELAPQPPRSAEEATAAREGGSATSSTRPDKPFEEIPEGEAEQSEEIADLTVKLLDKRYPAPKRILRGVHPKSHGCVKAVFEVNADIAKDLQVGLFDNPGKIYDAWIRFSNAAGRLGPDVNDGKHQSRGLGVKVLDVGGEVLLDDQGAHHQDFLMITEPAFVFANVADYLRLTRIMHEHNEDLKPFFAPLNPQVPGFSEEERERTKSSLQLVRTIESTPVANPLEVQYFSAAPFLFGPDRVMKFSVKPCAGEKPQVVPENPSENYLREALIETMSRDEDVCFDFMIQVRGKDEEGLNIENASTVWDEQNFPFIKVAKITIPAPQKDIDSPAAIEHCERLTCSPWHSLVEHRPLGGINRLRKAVYIASQSQRASRVVKPEDQSKEEVTKMTHVADYVAISDTGERLRGGDSHDFEFTLPRVRIWIRTPCSP